MKKLTGMTLVETRLAVIMLVPALLIVFAIIIFPVLANFWIAFKPVGLGDLRRAAPQIRERVTTEAQQPGDELVIEYRVRNTSQQVEITDVELVLNIPAGLTVEESPGRCATTNGRMVCSYDRWEGGYADRFEVTYIAAEPFFSQGRVPDDPTRPTATATAPNPLTNFVFTLDNFRTVFDARQFWPSVWVTIVYTLASTLGVLVLGLFAAELMNRSFKGKAIMRGMILFPYVAPVIAVAFTWQFFLDPFSGTLNALLQQAGIISDPIPFLSERMYEFTPLGVPVRIPLALTSIVSFGAWRYFPFAFLFILSRLQAIDDQLYESADLDGASPFQQFWHITIPQLWSVLSTLFLLRFMWTFNKFDDVFLLTGGAAGTKTLPILVYDNAFGRSDIGAGAATSVVLFFFLAIFLSIYFTTIEKEDQE
ncbi:MAG TPA: sugar ABC transporter permease [Spirochaetia bacterium]|nr:sugar ABC transporter permease [Spirochaetia bacterium]